MHWSGPVCGRAQAFAAMPGRAKLCEGGCFHVPNKGKQGRLRHSGLWLRRLKWAVIMAIIVMWHVENEKDRRRREDSLHSGTGDERQGFPAKLGAVTSLGGLIQKNYEVDPLVCPKSLHFR